MVYYLNKIISLCGPVKDNNDIREEVTEILKGYTLYDMVMEKGKFFLKDSNDNKMELFLDIDSLEISIKSLNQQKLITIKKIPTAMTSMKESTLEKRPKGVIFSVVSKHFMKSAENENNDTIFSLYEQRYTLTDETLKEFQNHSFSRIFTELVNLKNQNELHLKNISDYYSIFSVYFSSLIDINTNKQNDVYYVSLNEQDLRNTYKIFNSPTEMYRIYDLYRGLITPKNETDINLIHDGLLNDKCFNVRELENITSNEDNLVGPTTIPVSQEYYEYVKNFLKENYGYYGEISFDRDSLLNAITYKMSEIVKRDIARSLGMSYEDFNNLDTSKQQKLAKKVMRKRRKPDDQEGKSLVVSSTTDNFGKENPLKKVLKLLKK